MTIADDDQNPIPTKKLAKSLNALAALRLAMEQRLAETEPSLKNTPEAIPVDDQPPPHLTSHHSSSETVASAAFPAPSETRQIEKNDSLAEPVEGPKTSPQDTSNHALDPADWPRIMFRIADRSQRLMQEFLEKSKNNPKDYPAFDPAHISEAFLSLANRILNSPERFADAQLALWQGYLRIWQSTLAKVQGKSVAPIVTPSPSDKRFQDQDWQNVWIFDFIKQSYLLTAEWAHKLVHQEAGQLDPKLAQKLQFYTRQLVDAISPSNFWLTNPEVLRATLESGGENLIKGLENLLDDLERGHGMLRIRMSDSETFEVGKNLATTSGKIVYQNDLMQLIQYAPQTPQVAQTPLLIVPPWINKYYILDLREKNSFLRYLVQEGYTVFCISWVNPDSRHALTNFDDYMSDGVLAAMREIRRITSEPNVNVLGYCIGGTLLASTLAYLKAVPSLSEELPTIKSATYLVTMIDFSEPGDLGVFIDEDQVKVIEARMAKQGYLDAATMSTTFNLLRANDLIWSFVVNNYLLGREPFPFDILYWNADSTNLPAIMQSFYLRKMYMSNKLVEPNGLQMKGVALDIRQITTPSFLLSTHDDHIAPWRSTYKATQLYKGPVRFVLAGSGHIAGVINHPNAHKYGYWTNDTCPAAAEDWLSNAEQHRGSWWPEWLTWLKSFNGALVPARPVVEGLENAPGSYVKVSAI